MNGARDRDGGPLAHRIRSLFAGSLDLIRTRLELASADAELQVKRFRDFALLQVAGVFFLVMALVFLSLLIVVAFWETHRIAAVAGVAVFYLVIGAACMLVGQRKLSKGPRPFSATLDELRHDVERLRR